MKIIPMAPMYLYKFEVCPQLHVSCELNHMSSTWIAHSSCPLKHTSRQISRLIPLENYSQTDWQMILKYATAVALGVW